MRMYVQSSLICRIKVGIMYTALETIHGPEVDAEGPSKVVFVYHTMTMSKKSMMIARSKAGNIEAKAHASSAFLADIGRRWECKELGMQECQSCA